MRKTLIPLLIVILSAVGCTQKQKTISNDTSDTVNKENTTETDISNIEAYLKKSAIDSSLNELKVVKSLQWEKPTPDHGSAFTNVTAYIDADGAPVKIIENFRDGEYLPEGRSIFYLENNKIIFWKEEKDTWIDSTKTEYIEKRTLYKNGKPFLSQQRSTENYEYISTVKWNDIPTNHPSMKKAKEILEGSGRFKLHFISVIQSKNLFLLLGENKKSVDNRYITVVRVDKLTPFIKDLLSNTEKYKFRPVSITFNVVGGYNQPEFRVLTSIKWDN